MSRVRRQAAGWLRVMALLLAVQLLALAIWLASASARGSERVLDAGGELLRQLGSHRRDPPRKLVLNGLPIQVRSGTSDRSLEAVVDDIARACRRLGPRLDRVLEPAGNAGRALRAALPPGLLDATLRAQGQGRGAIACLDTGVGALSLDKLTERLHHLARDGDLAALGDLRFFYAEEHRGRTTYLLLATTGPVPLDRLFPERGDAPGRDPQGVPRPGASRRLLSAWQRDARPMLAVYATGGRPATVERRYRAQLRQSGAQIVRQGAEGMARWLLARRQGRLWLISFAQRDAGSQAAVTPLD